MVARQWGREREGKLEPPFCGSPLGILWSDPITKIQFRGFGSISALGDILVDLGVILTSRVSLHQDNP